MTIKYYVECPVCGKITLIRIQAGYLQFFPIKIYCKNCESLITGYYKGTNFKNLEIKFENVRVIDERELTRFPDYSAYVSPELLVPISEPVIDRTDMYAPAPFISSTMNMGTENIIRFQQNMRDALYIKDTYNTYLYNVNLQYLRKSNLLLKKLMYKELLEEIYPLSNELEIIQGLNVLNNKPIRLLETEYFNDFSNYSRSKIDVLTSNQSTNNELLKLVTFFNSNNMFTRFREKYSKLANSIYTNIYDFIPILSIKYYGIPESDVLDNFTLSTTSVEEILPIYQNAYEVFSEMLIIIIALDNIASRSDFSKLKTSHAINVKKNQQMSTITEFFNLRTKADKLKYILGDEYFEAKITYICDNHIRNAIGHFDTKITDSSTQEILFYNSSAPITKTLLEITLSTWDIFLSLNYISELFYQLEKVNCLCQGQTFTIPYNSK